MEEDILAELPDGRILQFPPNTSPEVIQATVKRELGITDTPDEPRIGPMGRVFLGATERGLETLATGEGPRMQNVREIVGATLRGEQTPQEAVLQTGGQGMAYLGDLIGAGLGYLGRGASAITPDFIEDEVINQLGIFMNQPVMRYGMQALGSGMEEYEQFAQEYPRAARNIEALTNIGVIGGGSTTAARQGGRLLADVGTGAIEEAGRIRRTVQTPARRQAAQDIESGGIEATNVRTAPYRLEEAPSGATTTVGPEGPVQPRPQMRAVVSPVQQEAIRQGFDEGLVAMIREASPTDRRNMLRSLNIMKQSIGNRRAGLLSRTTDIAGQSILDRYRFLSRTNRQAGQSIDRYVRNNLVGTNVDYSPAVNNFLSSLNNIGVRVKPDFTLDFSNSDIAGITGAQRALRNIFNRMSQDRTIDAGEVHKIKRYIDEVVTYGKSNQGNPLTGESVNIIKELRRDLDEILDTNFPEYDKANLDYAETIDALNNFQDVMGRSLNLESPRAFTGIGSNLRGLSSNNRSRARLLDSIEQMQNLSNKYGGQFDDDVINQTAFTIDLDKMFGTQADTSFAGQIREAGENVLARQRPGPSEIAVEAARVGIERMRGINTEAQFKAMEDLLKSFDD